MVTGGTIAAGLHRTQSQEHLGVGLHSSEALLLESEVKERKIEEAKKKAHAHAERATPQQQQQRERVQKAWCLSLRASVLPHTLPDDRQSMALSSISAAAVKFFRLMSASPMCVRHSAWRAATVCRQATSSNRHRPVRRRRRDRTANTTERQLQLKEREEREREREQQPQRGRTVAGVQ